MTSCSIKLQAGNYTITTYHTDIDDGTFGAPGFPQPGSAANRFDIQVTDALGVREAISDAVWSTHGETFSITSDGINTLSFRVVGDNPGQAAWLNGLVISNAIPEPSSILIAVFSIGGVAKLPARPQKPHMIR